jgi:hypothetical protein
MRIEFKSVPILDVKTTHTYDAVITTTTYNMADVRDHAVELPLSKLLFSVRTAGYTALFVLVPALLAAYFSGGDLAKVHTVVAVLLAAWAALSYAAAVDTVKLAEMRDAARRDRGAPPDLKLAAIENKRWASFAAKLKRENPFALPDFLAGSDVVRQLEARLKRSDHLAEMLRRAHQAREQARGDGDPQPPV